MELQGSLRVFRAVLITGMATSLAAAGHVLGGGALPGPATTAVLAALVLAPVAWLASRQLSFLALLGVLVSGQLMLHEGFTFLSPHALCLQPLAGQMSHQGAAMDCSAAVPVPMPPQIDSTDSPVMLAGHVLALLVTAWLLHEGEVALWQLLAWLRPLAQLPRPAGIIPVHRRPVPPGLFFVPVPRRNFRHDSLRGPPADASPRAMP